MHGEIVQQPLDENSLTEIQWLQHSFEGNQKRNVYTSSLTKPQHNEMSSAFFSDAQSFFSITQSRRETENKQKRQCYVSQWHTTTASFFENNLRYGDCKGANAIIGKNIDRAIFGHDLMKMQQETRSNRNRALSKEGVDFHLLMALAFHDLLNQKHDQLASLLDTNVDDRFNVKKIHPKSQHIRKNIRETN